MASHSHVLCFSGGDAGPGAVRRRAQLRARRHRGVGGRARHLTADGRTREQRGSRPQPCAALYYCRADGGRRCLATCLDVPYVTHGVNRLGRNERRTLVCQNAQSHWKPRIHAAWCTAQELATEGRLEGCRVASSGQPDALGRHAPAANVRIGAESCFHALVHIGMTFLLLLPRISSAEAASTSTTLGASNQIHESGTMPTYIALPSGHAVPATRLLLCGVLHHTRLALQPVTACCLMPAWRAQPLLMPCT